MCSVNECSPWRLKWTEELSVHIPEIDAEHQHFIQLVNVLNEAIALRKSEEEVSKCMHSLLEDAVAHFAHEEALFKEWKYPDAEEHAVAHAKTIKTLREAIEGSERNRTDYERIAAALKIKQVLIEHILLEDMKYRDYRSKMVSPKA